MLWNRIMESSFEGYPETENYNSQFWKVQRGGSNDLFKLLSILWMDDKEPPAHLCI